MTTVAQRNTRGHWWRRLSEFGKCRPAHL